MCSPGFSGATSSLFAAGILTLGILLANAPVVATPVTADAGEPSMQEPDQEKMASPDSAGRNKDPDLDASREWPASTVQFVERCHMAEKEILALSRDTFGPDAIREVTFSMSPAKDGCFMKADHQAAGLRLLLIIGRPASAHRIDDLWEKNVSKARQSIGTLRDDREARGYEATADLKVSETQMQMSIRIPDSPEGGSFRSDMHCSRTPIHVICLGTKFPEGTEGSTDMESSAFARFPAWEDYYSSFHESARNSEDPVETSD